MADNTTLENVATVNKLLKLAQDGSEESEEARTAAVQAARKMREHDLVIVPRNELEAAAKAVQGVEAIREEAKKQRQKGMALGALLGFLAGKRGLV